MTTLKETAEAYVPELTANIADLDYVDISIEIVSEEKMGKDGIAYKQNIVIVKGKKYRVPDSVLEGVKNLLKKIPSLKHITVMKSGSGMNTKYQVLPWQAEQKVV